MARLSIARLYQWTVTVVRFGQRKPNLDGNPTSSVDSLLSLLILKLPYDSAIVPVEAHCGQVVGCYMIL